ncbi:GntR family transcriptional regulator [Streptomyces sp. SL13]|uniref:GntR family transcriptional regulator n=1 Tax=Streptantibioticus silvisoli TaxID=2705255 RepID=A0AA90H6N8_9ACTN|nr:GntR family transcriptional regulator [Streptantibioticus silvisoli]MDI5971554.1 GntR family transcriptional regulator [Streptantibioticus silvisoli]
MAREAPYLEVADDLRRRIERGEWLPGARLPSRARLAVEYDVGRNVTQRAVDLLIIEELLVGRAGSGTFVREPRERRRLVRSVGRDVNAAMLAGTDIIELGRSSISLARSKVAPAPADIARRLRVAEGDLCMRTRYEFLADRRTAQLGMSWEPVAVTGGSSVHMPEMGQLQGLSVVERMRIIGVTVQSAKETLRPGRANRLEAARLSLNPGDLVTHIERTFYDSDGRPVETADFTVPDVRYEIVYEIGTPQD